MLDIKKLRNEHKDLADEINKTRHFRKSVCESLKESGVKLILMKKKLRPLAIKLSEAERVEARRISDEEIKRSAKKKRR